MSCPLPDPIRPRPLTPGAGRSPCRRSGAVGGPNSGRWRRRRVAVAQAAEASRPGVLARAQALPNLAPRRAPGAAPASPAPAAARFQLRRACVAPERARAAQLPFTRAGRRRHRSVRAAPERRCCVPVAGPVPRRGRAPIALPLSAAVAQRRRARASALAGGGPPYQLSVDSNSTISLTRALLQVFVAETLCKI